MTRYIEERNFAPMPPVKKPRPEKRAGFYANLPVSTIKKIRDLAIASNKPQWQVVDVAMTFAPSKKKFRRK